MSKSITAFEKLGIVTQTQLFPKVREHRGGRYQYAEFESLYEMQEKICKGYDDKVFNEKLHNGKLWGEDFGFFGEEKAKELEENWRFGEEHETLEKTREAMKYGTASLKTIENVEKLRETILNKESMQSLFHQARTLKKRRVFSDEGAELDIDRVLCADPYHWSKLTPGKKSNVMRIGINLSVNAGFSEREIQEIAGLGLIATELLHTAGFNTEVFAIYIGSNETDQLTQSGAIIKMKSATEPIDIQRLCGIGIVGIFRAFVFACITDVLDGTPTMGLGSAHGLDDNMKKMLDMDYVIDSCSTSESVEIEIGELITPKI